MQCLKAELIGSHDKLGVVEADTGYKEDANTARKACPNSVNDGVSLEIEMRAVCGASLGVGVVG